MSRACGAYSQLKALRRTSYGVGHGPRRGSRFPCCNAVRICRNGTSCSRSWSGHGAPGRCKLAGVSQLRQRQAITTSFVNCFLKTQSPCVKVTLVPLALSPQPRGQRGLRVQTLLAGQDGNLPKPEVRASRQGLHEPPEGGFCHIGPSLLQRVHLAWQQQHICRHAWGRPCIKTMRRMLLRTPDEPLHDPSSACSSA